MHLKFWLSYLLVFLLVFSRAVLGRLFQLTTHNSFTRFITHTYRCCYLFLSSVITSSFPFFLSSYRPFISSLSLYLCSHNLISFTPYFTQSAAVVDNISSPFSVILTAYVSSFFPPSLTVLLILSRLSPSLTHFYAVAVLHFLHFYLILLSCLPLFFSFIPLS